MRARATVCRYVGSPYQTSLSEAGQDKYFYCMQRSPVTAEELANARCTPITLSERSTSGALVTSAEDQQTSSTAGQPRPVASELRWRESERWVVNIGSKIFKVTFPVSV
jgi:hypothetical protein